MGQQHSSVHDFVRRSIDGRLREMNVAKNSISPFAMHLAQRRSYVLISAYLHACRNRSQRKQLRQGRITMQSFTPEEARDIDGILNRILAQTISHHCHVHCGENLHYLDISRSRPLWFRENPRRLTPESSYSSTTVLSMASVRSFSTPNLSMTRHDATQLEAKDEALSEVPSWALVSELSKEDAIKSPECIICLIEFGLTDRVMKLPCFHLFHQDCLLLWFKKQILCPVCRKDPREAVTVE